MAAISALGRLGIPFPPRVIPAKAPAADTGTAMIKTMVQHVHSLLCR